MTTVHARPEYQIRAEEALAPAGYPGAVGTAPIIFSQHPFAASYAARRLAYLDHVLRTPAPANTKPAWHELVRLAAGGKPHAGVFHAALDFIDARHDCADFVLHGILRLLYQFPQEKNRTRLPAEVYAHSKQTVLDFKYWPDEPRVDSLCTWTENHYILYASAGYLAGQLYPDEVFGNSGQTGREKMKLNLPRILRWLELRFRTGFSEWLSHVYYDEDLTALLSLYDFCQDERMRQQAAMVIDLLLFDIALNSFHGVFGSTHGRAYANTKKWAAQEGTTDTARLLFGMGAFSGFDNMSAAAFALSKYELPTVLEAVAQAEPVELLNRQHMGIRVDEAEKWGLGFADLEDGMHLLTLEAYLHPRSAALTLRMFDAFNWWENSFFKPFKSYRWLISSLQKVGLFTPLLRWLEWDVCRNTREAVDILTYKTPDYMLSSAPDYRPGFGGDQQHIWQATLGPDAVCFTTHPGRSGGPTPDEWAGSGELPRVAQVENVVIAVYRLRRRPALYVPTRHFYTHAWLPQDEFDEVVEQAGWLFARKGSGYLALYSRQPARWQTGGDEAGKELVAEGSENIWLCEMGRGEAGGGTGIYKDFADFVSSLLKAHLEFDGLNVTYHSPSQGVLRFGWLGELTQDGQGVQQRGFPRYANPYCQANFPAERMEIACGGHTLRLDWVKGERLVSRDV